jgi:RNA polymerase sigma-70 factor (ECF subfamily)
MLHTARNNQKFAFVQRNAAIAKLHAEAAAHYQEQLILGRMIVPDELALKFHHLHVLAVQFTHHTRIPMIGEQGQLLTDIDLFHVMRLSKLSQTAFERRYPLVSAPGELTADIRAGEAGFDLDALFRAHYGRVAAVIVRVVRDPARAEELAVEVFLKLSRNERAQGDNPEAWLYRTAVRIGLDELRRQTRRLHYESLLGFVLGAPLPTPEQIHAASEERERVRRVLSMIARRQAELLLLRSHGLSYEELASTLHLNPASVGTLLARAQQAFRKEYINRYGKQ